MHIPDGFLDLKTSVAADALAIGALAVALRDARRTLSPRRVPLLGLAAAFIFAGQMLNFPVAGGTSGHLVGSVLAAALLGPGAAVIALTAVLAVQCFVFADGGVLALGANIFNMGVIGALVGYALYRAVRRALGGGLRGSVAAAAFAAWVSTVLAAVCCAGELAASGTVPWATAFPAMAGVHMLIGVGEAIITAFVLVAVGQAHPELLYRSEKTTGGGSYQTLLGYGLITATGLALFLSPFASKYPDGLDRVAETHGFAKAARSAWTLHTPFAEYTVPGIESSSLATALAGLLGTAGVFLLARWGSRWLVPAEGRPLGPAK